MSREKAWTISRAPRLSADLGSGGRQMATTSSIALYKAARVAGSGLRRSRPPWSSTVYSAATS